MTRDEIVEALDEAANYVGGLYNGLPQDVEQRFIQATIEARAALTALPPEARDGEAMVSEAHRIFMDEIDAANDASAFIEKVSAEYNNEPFLHIETGSCDSGGGFTALFYKGTLIATVTILRDEWNYSHLIKWQNAVSTRIFDAAPPVARGAISDAMVEAGAFAAFSVWRGGKSPKDEPTDCEEMWAKMNDVLRAPWMKQSRKTLEAALAETKGE